MPETSSNAAQTDLSALDSDDMTFRYHPRSSSIGRHHVLKSDCEDLNDPLSITQRRAETSVAPRLFSSENNTQQYRQRRALTGISARTIKSDPTCGESLDDTSSLKAPSSSPFKPVKFFPLPPRRTSNDFSLDKASDDAELPRRGRSPKREQNHKSHAKRIGSDTLRTRADFLLAQRMSRIESSGTYGSSRSVKDALVDLLPELKRSSLPCPSPASVDVESDDRVSCESKSSRHEALRVKSWIQSLSQLSDSDCRQGPGTARSISSSFSDTSTQSRPLDESLEIFGISLPHTMALMQHLDNPGVKIGRGSQNRRRRPSVKHMAVLAEVQDSPEKLVSKSEPAVLPDSVFDPVDSLKSPVPSALSSVHISGRSISSGSGKVGNTKFEDLMLKLAAQRSSISSKRTSGRSTISRWTGLSGSGSKENTKPPWNPRVSDSVFEDIKSQKSPDFRRQLRESKDLSIRALQSESKKKTAGGSTKSKIPGWQGSYRQKQICKVKIPACFASR